MSKAKTIQGLKHKPIKANTNFMADAIAAYHKRCLADSKTGTVAISSREFCRLMWRI